MIPDQTRLTKGIGTLGNEHLANKRNVFVDREMQCRISILSLGIHISARHDEQIAQLDMVITACIHERRHVTYASRFQVGSLGNQMRGMLYS
jgi:hypothetical protein